MPQKANRPAGFGPRVRVKGCGKSAPRTRQRGRHGKPHREQDRIGTTRRSSARPRFQASRPGWLREAAGNGRPRGMAATFAANAGPYRTRLTGRLTPSFLKFVHRIEIWSEMRGKPLGCLLFINPKSDLMETRLSRSTADPPSSVDAHNIPCYPKSSCGRCSLKGAAAAQASPSVPSGRGVSPIAGDGGPVWPAGG